MGKLVYMRTYVYTYVDIYDYITNYYHCFYEMVAITNTYIFVVFILCIKIILLITPWPYSLYYSSCNV